ncbi:MAG TPA: hypothetical protein VFV97_09430 [Rhodanobacteraceae bacterium]|nr:hypothetical protein [Rhodanobacteraceae bacterium]
MRNRFVWAAVSALVPLLVPVAASAAPQGDGIDLAVTLGTDPTEGACGTDTTLSVTAGDQVNYCYLVTNHTDETLYFSTLEDDVTGAIFTDQATEIPVGGTYQYNRLVTATTSTAPNSTWTAYDVHPDYVYADNTAGAADTIFAGGFDATAAYGFVDITATGTNLMLNDDDYTVASIGFPFTFYGHTADSLTVSNNGGMLFDQATGPDGRTGYLSPNTRTLPDRLLGPAILPYWDDLQQDYLDGIGNVFVETDGQAPNRRFIVEWFNLPVNVIGGGYNITFEAILYEGSNQILFQYLDVDCSNVICDDGAAATIGLNDDATTAILYSYREATVNTGSAILFSPTTPDTYTANAQATLDVGAPVVTADPASFAKTLSAGASTTDTLTIGNTGNRPLTWNIGSVNGTRSHFPPAPRFALPVGDPSQTHIGPAPVPLSTKIPATRTRGPLGVPAFAADPLNARLVSFDAKSPSSLTADLDTQGLQFLSGDFIGEDFSTLYAIDFRSFQLYKVDTATGTPTLVYLTVPPPGVSADGWIGMAWDASTSTMFAVTSGGRTPVSTLVKLNTETAETELVGPITGVGDPNNGTVIIDIAIDPNGNMYGIDIVTDTLVAIDKTTGEASTIGSIGFDANYSEGLDFDDTTGTLYFSGWDNGLGEAILYTIDTDTGLATPISPIGPNAGAVQYSALAIARDVGICSYPTDVPWLSYSATRGSTQPGDTSPITVTFDATSLAPGDYSADICVTNNDLTNKRLPVPVTLTVQ